MVRSEQGFARADADPTRRRRSRSPRVIRASEFSVDMVATATFGEQPLETFSDFSLDEASEVV